MPRITRARAAAKQQITAPDANNSSSSEGSETAGVALLAAPVEKQAPLDAADQKPENVVVESANEVEPNTEELPTAAKKSRKRKPKKKKGKAAESNCETAESKGDTVEEETQKTDEVPEVTPVTDEVDTAHQNDVTVTVSFPTLDVANPIPSEDTTDAPNKRRKRKNSKKKGPKTVTATEQETFTQEPIINTESKDDSFIENIQSRTPARVTRGEIPTTDVQEIEPYQSDKSPEIEIDSFVEQITSRSPAKMITRIEDSVEAIDALEEAIEQVGEALPAIDQRRSPKKVDNTKETVSEANAEKATDEMAETKVSRSSPRKAVATKSATKPAATRSTTRTTVVPASRQKDRKNSDSSTTSTSGTLKSTDGNGRTVNTDTAQKAAAAKKPRAGSVSFPAPAPPPKSSKPPTRATFVLPGEAVAKKLKEQKEERLKREAEEKKRKAEAEEQTKKAKTRDLRARTASKTSTATTADAKSHAPACADKQTAASKARTSLVHHEVKNIEPTMAVETRVPATTAVSAHRRVSSMTSLRPTTRSSVLPGHSKNGSISETTKKIEPPKAATMTTLSVPKRTATVAQPFKLSTRATSTSASTSTKSAGRALYAHDKADDDSKERERRAKEEAARKARSDAAERGRIASREWAEKQKLRVKKEAAARAAGLASSAATTTMAAADKMDVVPVSVAEAGIV
ncbi:MAG: hypothetical protein M1819_002025 [Sarea resinae]|nr:MAG: hypothetical protein M1819_002025 [Sarea resinae]